jgi:hypothetical protein
VGCQWRFSDADSTGQGADVAGAPEIAVNLRGTSSFASYFHFRPFQMMPILIMTQGWKVRAPLRLYDLGKERETLHDCRSRLARLWGSEAAPSA